MFADDVNACMGQKLLAQELTADGERQCREWISFVHFGTLPE